MNTGFVRLAVATVPTVYGIETGNVIVPIKKSSHVATVPTVYGIETFFSLVTTSRPSSCCNSTYRLRYWNKWKRSPLIISKFICCNSTYRLRYWNKWLRSTMSWKLSELQQYLPFTVLKPLPPLLASKIILSKLQQYLPFTVLKLINLTPSQWWRSWPSCNSTYRLRYWNSLIVLYYIIYTIYKLQQYLPFTVLKHVT